MKKIHDIKHISFDGPYIILAVDGTDYRVDLHGQSEKLAGSSDAVKNNYIVSPSGYGIRWPDIDEDLSIDGLIGVKHKSGFSSNKTA
ncbi:MAG: DUF2442 domain-containing protein [Spirochaetes bacterium]|nr:DUF2442 domain-containing protein [Spirochaetota bacterium]